MPPTPSSCHTVAIFDFDGTLIKGDSLLPFLAMVAGWPRTIFALAESVGLWMVRKKPKPGQSLPFPQDIYTFMKGHLLHRLLKGNAHETLSDIIHKLRKKQQWNESVLQRLREHHTAGHHIVIASGGLDLYLPGLLQDLPYHTLICTQVGTKDGMITGEMPVGNCVRQRKAEMLTDYFNQNTSFTESWGYGNFPQDLPMLALVKHRIII